LFILDATAEEAINIFPSSFVFIKRESGWVQIERVMEHLREDEQKKEFRKDDQMEEFRNYILQELIKD
jgi:hypothetical protein